MQKTNDFEAVFQHMKGILPIDPFGLKADFEKNLRAALQSALTRMNVVTREEFDVQSAVLARTRQKVTELEKKLSELESRLTS
jgi:ubiquinone biosynthesis accessory factor UbiK